MLLQYCVFLFYGLIFMSGHSHPGFPAISQLVLMIHLHLYTCNNSGTFPKTKGTLCQFAFKKDQGHSQQLKGCDRFLGTPFEWCVLRKDNLIITANHPKDGVVYLIITEHQAFFNQCCFFKWCNLVGWYILHKETLFLPCSIMVTSKHSP